MNASELIDFLKRPDVFLLEEFEADSDDYSGDYMQTRTRDATEERDDIIRELSRTRIRETATEPPTREDADVDENVLAIDKAIDSHTFNIRIYQFVERDPDRFPFWTSLPQLPEVTP